jgi:acetyl-CoA C-acetyltransferase/acetyl-CoA acyltransferase
VAALECGLTDPTCGLNVGATAEILAQEFGISRREQDEFALRSHQRAAAAAAAGRLQGETVPVYAGERCEPVTADVGPRPRQTLDALSGLPAIFDRRDGTVTVGNSCQVTDGAAAVLALDADLARAEGLEPLGYVRAYAYAGLDAARMGLGPVFAIETLPCSRSTRPSPLRCWRASARCRHPSSRGTTWVARRRWGRSPPTGST